MVTKVTFAANGGLDFEREEALKKGFIIGKQYTLMGGKVQGFSSYYEVLEIDGKFNTCMFEESWQDNIHFLHCDF